MQVKQKKMFTLLETGLIGTIGALLFLLLHLPLAWLLGATTAVMVWRLGTRRTLAWPSSLRHLAHALLGFMLGSSFYGVNISQMATQLPYMAGTTVFTVVTALVLGYIISRRANMNLINSIFGSVPGGLNHIIALSSESKHMEMTIVIFMQTIRSITVTFMVPFITLHALSGMNASGMNNGKFSGEETSSVFVWALFAAVAAAGFFVGKRIRLPASSLTGPLLATTIVVLSGISPPPVPYLLLLLAQLCIGIHIGLQMKPGLLSGIRKLGIYTVASSVIMVMCSLFCAFLLTRVTPIDLTTAFLSTSPGGIAEMGVTAALVHADLSIVSEYQLFRLFFVIFVVIPVLQWFITRQHSGTV